MATPDRGGVPASADGGGAAVVASYARVAGWSGVVFAGLLIASLVLINRMPGLAAGPFLPLDVGHAEPIVEGVTTLRFLFFLLVLQALDRPAAGPLRGGAASWSEVPRRIAADVLAGARTLSRLDAARRDRLGRPWS